MSSSRRTALIAGAVTGFTRRPAAGRLVAWRQEDRHGAGTRHHKDLELLSEPIEVGKVRPRIDRRYRFADLPAAIAYLEQGHARGKVVVGMT
jgi:NADPH:quinone reductase-like Zn-dependent oxidoreductase